MLSKFLYFGIVTLMFFSSCKNKGEVNRQSNDYKKIDSLKIDYLKINIVGNKLIPKNKKTDYENFNKNNLLLLFESDYRLYAFYNKKKNIGLLKSKYWSQLMIDHIFLNNKDSLINHPRFSKVEYNDPYLTGFYNKSDSIIIGKYHLKKSEAFREPNVQLNYIYTKDSLLVFDHNIKIGSSAQYVMNELDLSVALKAKDDFQLVLMEATDKISNAWYNNFPDLYSNFSSIIVMEFANGHLVSIKYLDGEYADYVFRNKTINTRDIHYH